MAQTGYTPISLYYSTTAAAAPTAGNLANGELGINITDGKLYYKDNAGVVQLIASKAGSSGDVVGPASATANAVARFDSTTGKLIKNSVMTIADDGAVQVANVVESTSGGFKFPDGTTQTTAATGSGFPSGTKMLFAQTTAPTGWTKDIVNYNDYALRVVTGTASSGGTVAFSTAFDSQTPAGSVSSSFSSGAAASTTATGTIANTTATGSVATSGGVVAATTLALTQSPAHSHAQGGGTAFMVTAASGTSYTGATGTAPFANTAANTNSQGGGLSHTHTFTNPTSTFTGTAHNHTFTGTAHTHTVTGTVSSSFTGTAINLAVKYLDVILATKD